MNNRNLYKGSHIFYISEAYHSHAENIKMNEFTLTKHISKQGSQSIIIIPTFLKDKLKPKTLVELKIKILDGIENEQ